MNAIKPILFNTEMTRGLLDGTKTVTRRVVKPQPRMVYYDGLLQDSGEDACDGRTLYVLIAEGQNGSVNQIVPPYQPSDILYVRETFFKYAGEYVYKASAAQPELWDGMWHPSIHMPREAARIFLRVTDVRVDRLQEITNEQAIREGIEPHEIMTNNAGTYIEYRIPGTHDVCPEAWGAFTHLWNSTIKPADRALYGWEANPWVWVIEFERCEKPAEVREAKR